MKLVDVKSRIYIDLDKKNNKEDPKFKVGNNVRIRNIRKCLQKAIFQIGMKKFLWLKKLKALFHSRVGKLRKPATNYMLNGKSTIALLVVRLIKKDIVM